MSQTTNPSKTKPKRYGNSKAANPFNQFYLDEFIKLQRQMEFKQIKYLAHTYRKVIQSLTRYPFPILSHKQVTMIAGVGESTVKKFQQLITQNATEQIQQNKTLIIDTLRRQILVNKSFPLVGIEDPTEQINHILLQQSDELLYKKYVLIKDLDQYQQVMSSCKRKHHQIQREKNAAGRFESPLLKKRTKKQVLFEENSQNWVLLVCAYLSFISNNTDETYVPLAQCQRTFELMKKDLGNKIKIEKVEKKGSTLFTNSYLEKEGKIGYRITLKGMDKAKDILRDCQIDLKLKPLSDADGTIKYQPSLQCQVDLFVEMEDLEKKSKKDDFAFKPLLEAIDEIEAGIQQFQKEADQFHQENDLTSFGNEKSLKNDSRIHSYELILFIDNREIKTQKDRNYLYEKIIANNITAEKKSLPLGDALWVLRIKRNKKINEFPSEFNSNEEESNKYLPSDEEDDEIEEYVLDLIVERKTVDDLASSIIDGRYDEQKYRLKNCGLSQVIYLVEGELNHKNKMVTAVESAIIHTKVYNSFFIVRVESIQETVKWLTLVSHELMRELSSFNYERIHNNLRTFEDFSQDSGKNANLNVKSLFSRQLRVITGCGPENSQALSQVFKTPQILYKHLKKCKSNYERENLLQQAKKEYNKDNTIDIKDVIKCQNEYSLSSQIYSQVSVKKIQKKPIELISQLYMSDTYI